jgi:excisionase family DNA binding protein
MNAPATEKTAKDAHGQDRYLLLAVQQALSLEDVALLLGLGKRTVEDLVDRGLLSSVIVPGTKRARRVTRAQLDAFVLGMELQNGFRRPKAA